MELIVRGSEYESFLTCRKQWYYRWIENLEPKKPDKKLFIGTLFHKWLENYYNANCEKLSADFETTMWFNDQDKTDMEQTDIDEVLDLCKKMADYYDETYRDQDKQTKTLATELNFIVKLDDSIYYTGTIDRVYERPDGKIRFMDHKTASSISQYEEKSKMDRQISRYWWALQQISAGIGKVKDAHGNWVPFKEIEGKEISGFDYNLIAKDYPKEPKVLKSGKLSMDKNQKTTYKKFVNKLHEMGLSAFPSEYEDYLKFLMEKPDPFLKRINVIRTQNELDAAIWEFFYTAGDMHDVKMIVTRQPEMAEQITYRNIGLHCETFCPFKSLCQTTIEGGNVSLVKNLGYKQKEEIK